jgi:molybdenum cofactor biosynthesis enzyme MoaA
MQKTVNNSFCVMPFVHLHINEDDQVKPCCYGNPIKQYSDAFDYVNDPELNSIRSKMLAGEAVSHCENCYNVERAGGESYRIRNNKEWENTTSPRLVYYDIRNDNTCNLLCRMCHPGASSQIDKEYKEIGWQWHINPRKYKLTEVVDITTIEKLFVAGGEPTLMPEFTDFLEQAIAQGRTDIALRISTNATNINKKIARLLAHFNDIEFTVSIDGYDQINRYIRWPSDWKSITTNVHRLFEITRNVSFNVTVSMWNISNLSKLIFFLESTYPPPPTIFLNEAMAIPYGDATPFNYPDKEDALADLIKMKDSVSYQQEEFFKNKLDYFISKLDSAIVDIDKLEKFFNYNDRLDESRHVKLNDYIPELEQCRNYLTKQI